ncbi:hypothetical protein [Oceanobacillus damuensis]|uniref:hypothetical protein n=1 Tax=Oceanobacillus damuensis TaxID=937928 RepID=UPI000829B800|nr:hypothetical protein [Oceanobacillus damuensis]
MTVKNERDGLTYPVLAELKDITRLTNAEGSLNLELETFSPKVQRKILKTMRELMSDEMVFVLSVENMTRRIR